MSLTQGTHQKYYNRIPVTAEDNDDPPNYPSALIKIGHLREQLENLDRILLIQKVRSEINVLERKFVRPQIRNDTRKNKWTEILKSTSQFYTSNVELNQFRARITVDHDVFIKTICEIYGDSSEKSGPDVSFAVLYNRKSIENMFIDDIGIIPNDARVETVEALLNPIP